MSAAKFSLHFQRHQPDRFHRQFAPNAEILSAAEEREPEELAAVSSPTLHAPSGTWMA
jgi:hypothetical protein